MAPRKLSDSDKQSIVDLYRQPGETTSTLADQFGVSNSTISRILKNAIPKDEYSELISQKRMSGGSSDSGTKRRKKSTASKKAASPKQETADKKTAAVEETPTDSAVESPKLKLKAREADTDGAGRKRRRRRSSKAVSEDNGQLPLLDTEEAEETESKTASKTKSPRPVPKPKPAPVIEEEDDEDDDDLTGLDETLGDDFGDDDDLEDELEDEEEDSADEETSKPKLRSERGLEIMPLGRAELPKPCYLVVDMRAELITRPLSEFADTGQIPASEEQEKTLPVFDNHRVARRFSRNKQRVIKVPDGSLITRTSPYLTAKGITRLFVDGQVFNLIGAED